MEGDEEMPRPKNIIGICVLSLATGYVILMVKDSLYIAQWTRTRVLTSKILYQFRNIAEQLDTYRLERKQYPPLSETGPVYTYISDSLTSPLRAFSSDFTAAKEYIGPPADPFRDEQIFAGEMHGEVRYRCKDCGGPEFWKGYPPRYYRNGAGDFFLLLSNGPDRDEDLTLEVLERVTSPTFESFTRQLADCIYDATNGSNSNGDVFRGSW